MIRTLIRCSTCNRVIPNYGGYILHHTQSLPGVEWSNADLATAKEFLRTHSGHQLEKLVVETDSYISEKPAYQPVGVTYIFASNADRKFLIRRTRMALDQPTSYEVIPAELRLSNVSLRIQEYDLHRQVASDKKFSLLLKRKMEKFIEAFREEIEGINARDFEMEAEAIEEGETSLIAYGSLKEVRWKRILKRCGRYFKESELEIVKAFIEENRIPPDVLSVQIRRRISLIQVPAMASTDAASQRGKIGIPLEAESEAMPERKSVRNR